MPRLKKSAPKSAKKKMPPNLHQGSDDKKLTSPAEKKAIAMSDSTKEMPGKMLAGSKNTRAIADKNNKKRKTRRSS